MKTKIIATIGPSSSPEKVLKEMILAGADVCRINMSHGTHEEHQKVIETIDEINKELKIHVPVLGDLQGPKLRIGEVKSGTATLRTGSEITITTKACTGNNEVIPITYSQFPLDTKPGEKILIDDGKIHLEVLSTNKKDEVVAKIIQGGILSSHKGFNLPNTNVSLPCLTEKDLEDLNFLLDNKVQWIALSFVRSASDIIDLKHIIANHRHRKSPMIIAKIEKPEALDDIDNIIREVDGIMVARGDLGVEMPLQNVPMIQKMLVKKCLKASKPIIVATQMMESMIDNLTPTRAEANDVANSVMDGADALMLSGETSVGKFPVRVIETMQKIISQVEGYEDIYYKHNLPQDNEDGRFISDSIIFHACEMSQQTNAKAIIAMTHTGYSAFKIASQRPRAHIFIFTNNHALLSTLNLIWGVKGFYYGKFISTDHTIEDIKYLLRKNSLLNKGDLVVNIAATPIKELGKTNTVKLSHV